MWAKCLTDFFPNQFEKLILAFYMKGKGSKIAQLPLEKKGKMKMRNAMKLKFLKQMIFLLGKTDNEKKKKKGNLETEPVISENLI